MKKSAITLVTVFLIMATDASAARGYGHGYRHGGYGHHGHGAYRHYGGNHHFGNRGAYLVGGVLLGALLAPPRYAPPPRVVYLPQPVPPVQVAVAPPVVARAPVGRSLLRDINGNCFERKTDASGTELRVQLPASECAW